MTRVALFVCCATTGLLFADSSMFKRVSTFINRGGVHLLPYYIYYTFIKSGISQGAAKLGLNTTKLPFQILFAARPNESGTSALASL